MNITFIRFLYQKVKIVLNLNLYNFFCLYFNKKIAFSFHLQSFYNFQNINIPIHFRMRH